MKKVEKKIMLCREKILVYSINLDELFIYAFQYLSILNSILTDLTFDSPQCNVLYFIELVKCVVVFLFFTSNKG